MPGKAMNLKRQFAAGLHFIEELGELGDDVDDVGRAVFLRDVDLLRMHVDEIGVEQLYGGPTEGVGPAEILGWVVAEIEKTLLLGVARGKGGEGRFGGFVGTDLR